MLPVMAQPQRGHRDELVAQLVPQLEQVEQLWHPPPLWPEPPQDAQDPEEQVGRPL